jgi:hypothetical protein
MQPPVRDALAQQRLQDPLDQCQAANAACVCAGGGHLEGDSAAIGVADEMDRSGHLRDLIAQQGDFFRRCRGKEAIPN